MELPGWQGEQDGNLRLKQTKGTIRSILQADSTQGKLHLYCVLVWWKRMVVVSWRYLEALQQEEEELERQQQHSL